VSARNPDELAAVAGLPHLGPTHATTATDDATDGGDDRRRRLTATAGTTDHDDDESITSCFASSIYLLKNLKEKQNVR
jgi:hypothetical protein